VSEPTFRLDVTAVRKELEGSLAKLRTEIAAERAKKERDFAGWCSKFRLVAQKAAHFEDREIDKALRGTSRHYRNLCNLDELLPALPTSDITDIERRITRLEARIRHLKSVANAKIAMSSEKYARYIAGESCP